MCSHIPLTPPALVLVEVHCGDIAMFSMCFLNKLELGDLGGVAQDLVYWAGLQGLQCGGFQCLGAVV